MQCSIRNVCDNDHTVASLLLALDRDEKLESQTSDLLAEAILSSMSYKFKKILEQVTGMNDETFDSFLNGACFTDAKTRSFLWLRDPGEDIKVND